MPNQYGAPVDFSQLQSLMLGGMPLAALADTPAGEAQYRALSVPERLKLLQGQQGRGALHDRDALLLKLLRARREREAAAGMPPAAPPQQSGSVVQFGRDAIAARQALLDALSQGPQ